MVNNRAQCLFGTETELGVFARFSGTTRPAPTELATAIVEDVGTRYKHVPSPRSSLPRRIFLSNGGCIYADIGGHPEIASAECSSPIELAAQSLALRRILAKSADTVGRIYGMPISLIANNMDYALGGAKTYGHHLNVLVAGIPIERAARELTPLLAAMPVLGGAGKVSFADRSAGFELSQRAGYMCAVMSKRTTDSRAMVTCKDEPLSKNGLRLHVISIDTAMSPWQLVLVPSVLALSVKAIEAGCDVAERLALADPVRALQTVSCDPSLKAELPLVRGGATTALDILGAYLEMVKQASERVSMPDWAKTIVSLWGEILANLRSNPFLECGRLDWVTKLVAFTRQLEREGLNWQEFSRWTYVLASVRRLKATWPELDVLAMTTSSNGRTAIRRSALGTLERHFAKNALSWKGFARIWRVTGQLCAQCVKYHTLNSESGPQDISGKPCPMITKEMVDIARISPPKGTRARLRGQAIQDASVGAEGGWSFVKTAGRRLVLGDAFGSDASWVEEKANSNKEQE